MSRSDCKDAKGGERGGAESHWRLCGNPSGERRLPIPMEPQIKFVAGDRSMLLLGQRKPGKLLSGKLDRQTSFIMSSVPAATVGMAGSGGAVPSTASAWLTPLELTILGA